MSEWKEYKLGEVLLSANTGLDAIKRAPIVSNNTGRKCIRIQDISQNKKYDDWGFTEVSENNFQKFKLLKNDIIVARTGATVGVNIIIKSSLSSVFNNGLIRLRVKDDFDSDYISYLLRGSNYWNHINSIAFGTTSQPNIQINQLLDYRIKVPVLKSTQTAIAEVLSSLDDKIELNNKINQELEALAQALFKRWFVDFEFPNCLNHDSPDLPDIQDLLSNKNQGNPENPKNHGADTYKSSGGEMVESELGEIPKGWEVKTLKDEFDLNMGQSPKGETYNTNGDGLIFFQGRSDFGFRYPSIRMYTNDPKKIAKKFETLISVRAPVGDINMASEDCCIGRGLGSISHPLKLYSYTYYKILSIQDELKSYDNEGTVFGSINKETLGNIKCITPPIDICKSFNDLSVANDALIFNMVNECQELVNTRDTLLPKLISGELEVNGLHHDSLD